jgi:hypothetical protein
MSRSSKKVPRFFRGQRFDAHPVVFDIAKKNIELNIDSLADNFWLDLTTETRRPDEITMTTRKMRKSLRNIYKG